MMARTLLKLRDELKINLIFKSSFDKADDPLRGLCDPHDRRERGAP